MFKIDKETEKLMKLFKTVSNKQEVADKIAEMTVNTGINTNSKVFQHYYGEYEPEFVTMTCISFGLMHMMPEDFYIMKEVLGYNYVYEFLYNQDRYLNIV